MKLFPSTSALILAASTFALPQLPDLPTDTTNMVGGLKWYEAVMKLRHYRAVRRHEATSEEEERGAEACKVESTNERTGLHQTFSCLKIRRFDEIPENLECEVATIHREKAWICS
ncbi:uncharacterized protein SEPMUDRAFT_119381 [Sphaerulina musiva SO2202]|uniref:Uncharacterized protein n=1 Tax=Sphaerulina musiva (strain SO2202) TaxID=692275 RepID=N1QI69_SPHMS|nr:uncharacterized protein SEPMUDRAFT_119381 [Sphaerulina musiva SO2202]EMF10863.1 hypothetical protein SEPMUDRAFT_119381 [Sphaerulina musiva SO2202]